MQIKAKIACAGDEGLSQFPGLPCHIEELGDGRGGIDESKLRTALANDQINIGSNRSSNRNTLLLTSGKRIHGTVFKSV